MNTTIQLGDKVKDTITGFTGVAVCISKWLNGCVRWTKSRKVYAHVYIDDSAICCPVLTDSSGQRVMVDWSIVGPEVLKLCT